jgi:hypothetical protein
LSYYRITVRAEGQGPPAIIRLRRFLKVLLRVAGLRCVGAVEVVEGAAGGEVKHPRSQGEPGPAGGGVQGQEG